MTAREWINSIVVNKESRDQCCSVISSLFCVDASEISFLAWLKYCQSGDCAQRLIETENGAQERKFVGGSMKISQEIAKELNRDIGQNTVKLNHVVTNINTIKSDSTDIGGSINSTSSTSISDNSDDYIEITTRITKTNENDDNDGYLFNTFKTRFVIVAIPPTLYRRIDWNPKLSWKFDTLSQRMSMGCIIKTNAYFPKAFWRENGRNGMSFTSGDILFGNNDENPITSTFDDCKPLLKNIDNENNNNNNNNNHGINNSGNNNNISYNSGNSGNFEEEEEEDDDVDEMKDEDKESEEFPSLMGFILGDQARNLTDKYSKEERKELVLKQYCKMFGNDKRFINQCIGYVEKIWHNEKYSSGCYVGLCNTNLLSQQCYNDIINLNQLNQKHSKRNWYCLKNCNNNNKNNANIKFSECPREGNNSNIFFAGTELAASWQGYMDGAVQAGERAANKVANLLIDLNETTEATATETTTTATTNVKTMMNTKTDKIVLKPYYGECCESINFAFKNDKQLIEKFAIPIKPMEQSWVEKNTLPSVKQLIGFVIVGMVIGTEYNIIPTNFMSQRIKRRFLVFLVVFLLLLWQKKRN